MFDTLLHQEIQLHQTSPVWRNHPTELTNFINLNKEKVYNHIGGFLDF